jgi:hypothetical protein
MDETEPQLSIPAHKLRRLGPGLRTATAKGLKYDFDCDSYTFPGFWKYDRLAQGKHNTRVNRVNRQRKAAQNSRQWILDSQDGAELARSHARLPSDASRLKPRLKRQEAFRIPKAVFTSDVIENDSDLYRLGLLYDDEHARGSGFNLDTIVHSEPIYAVRAPKRSRKSYFTERIDNCSCLALDLSFSSLGDDQALAQLLAFEFDIQCDPADEPAAQGRADDIVPVSTTQSTPLHVIYELFEDSTHSLALSPPVDVFPDSVSVSEGEEDGNNDWDLVPHLERDTSDAGSEVLAAEEDAGAAAEAWIILGET